MSSCLHPWNPAHEVILHSHERSMSQWSFKTKQKKVKCLTVCYFPILTPAHSRLYRWVRRQPEFCRDSLSPLLLHVPLSSPLWWSVNWPQRHYPLPWIPWALRQLSELCLENLSSWGSWHTSERTHIQHLVLCLKRDKKNLMDGFIFYMLYKYWIIHIL